ncbi:MAG TPA: PAS domain S-box protein, partial [Candidatus Tenderia electrophaga]|nr:PAS domain S-box protein [Candidatus Tenderia electrophaga]
MTTDANHLSSLLAAIPAGVQEINLNGVITYSNPKHHEMLGYAAGELIGLSIFDLAYSADEKNKIKNYLDHLIAEQPAPTPYITVSRHKGGLPITTQLDFTYLRDENDSLTGLVFLITNQTEQQNKRSKERDLAQHYLDAAQFMIVILDSNGNI